MVKQAELKYQHLIESMRQEIFSGSWPAGYKVSTDIELAAQYRTTKATVGRAMQELVGQGLVERYRGRGTFVRARRQFAAAIVFARQMFSPEHGRSMAALLLHLESELLKEGWSSQYFLGVCDDLSAERLKYSLDRGWFDGVIVVSDWFADSMAKLLKPANGSPSLKQPAIVGAYPYDSVDRWVVPHHDHYGEKGVEALYARGRRRLALVAGANDFPLHAEGAEDGYRRAMAQCGLPVNQRYIHITPRKVEAGYQAFMALWSDPATRPDGIVTDDEVIAQGIVRGMVETAAHTPDELILASQVADGTAHFMAIPFIELRTPVKRWAEQLVGLLKEELAGLDTPHNQHSVPITVHDPFEG